VEASLEGHWQPQHLFAHRQMAACDAPIEEQLRTLNATRPAVAPVDKKQIKKVRHNAPAITGLHGCLHQLCGGRAASVLRACCERAASVLRACCERAASVLRACCERAAGVDAAGLDEAGGRTRP
jgi:hypothetical protein